MVLGFLVAVAAGVAICHISHKRKRLNAFKRDYEAHNGPLTEEEWKQLCREHKQALKADRHARKADRHMCRAERRGCWRTSLPTVPTPHTPPAPPAPEMDVKYNNGDGFPSYDEPSSLKQMEVPVQGPDEPPAYVPGSVAAPPEKM